MNEAVRDDWPDLFVDTISPTVEAMHLFSQVAGKVRMGLTGSVSAKRLFA